MSSSASGRFVLRMDPGLHVALRTRAREQGSSLNELCVGALREQLGMRERFASPLALDLTAIQEVLGPRYLGLVLYGSRARGDSRPDSDRDLMVVLDSGVLPSSALQRRLDSVLRDARNSLTLSQLPEASAHPGNLWLEIAVEGVVVDDRGGEVARSLIQLRHQIANGRFTRKLSHGIPYWVENPSV